MTQPTTREQMIEALSTLRPVKPVDITITITKDQLCNAFNSETELTRFINTVIDKTNEQLREVNEKFGTDYHVLPVVEEIREEVQEDDTADDVGTTDTVSVDHTADV